jgi:pSer/pThr/pTyr-binding forkhead associated (FHA) protein
LVASSPSRKEFELGVVCGRCDTYSSLGTATCGACGRELSLASLVSLAANDGGGLAPTVGEREIDEDVTPPRIEGGARASHDIFPAATVETMSRVAPTVSALFADDLKPRRSASGGGPAASSTGSVSAVRAHGGDKAVSSASAPQNRRLTGAYREAGSNVSSPGSQAETPTPPVRSVEDPMDQAKNYVCKSCSTPVPLGHKFCGRCGAAVPPEILHTRTSFFGQLQTPGKAKLILIRGEGVEGLSYQLNAEHHTVGRVGQLVLPDDPFVSPRHANLFYRAGKLVVRDEGSLNGVFWRVHGTVEVSVGDHFLTGEQLFRIDGPVKATDGPAPDGTYFYSSPKHQAQFKLVQILQGGAPAMAVCARGNGLVIGREGGDLNFPMDLYMSASHCRIEEVSGRLTLTDLGSRNGTYMRLQVEKELAHGDYLFIGRKLLRVEVTN